MDKRIDRKNQQVYLDGLKKYHEKGIPILINGEEADVEDWEQIFEVGEDGGFYMGDYVGTDEGRLTEIRFDKVYNK